jgi:hypothetical protein
MGKHMLHVDLNVGLRSELLRKRLIYLILFLSVAEGMGLASNLLYLLTH